MESILVSIKKMLGVSEKDTNFDTDIKIHINSVLMILTQLGVGPKKGFRITDEKETWNDFLGYTADSEYIEGVKTYVYIRVKLVFDPPTSSSLAQALKEESKEYEWRLNIQVDK